MLEWIALQVKSMEEVIKEKLAEPSEDRISSLLECSFIDGHSKRQNEAGIVFSPRTHKGKISYLGPNTIRENINFLVAFQEILQGGETGLTYGSEWPQWAYEIAIQSMLHDKSLLVVGDQLPMESQESKLVSVCLLQ